VTEEVARIYLDEAMAMAPKQADVLVLACTHYPLLTPLLRRIVPAEMQIVDSAESTARLVRKMIHNEDSAVIPTDKIPSAIPSDEVVRNGGRSRSRGTSIAATMFPVDHRTFRFYVTDSVDKFKRLAARFLGRQVDNVEHVDLGG